MSVSGANAVNGLIPTGSRNGNEAAFTAFDGELWFAGDDNNAPQGMSGLWGLWRTDGTAAGTQEITGIAGTSPGWNLEPAAIRAFILRTLRFAMASCGSPVIGNSGPKGTSGADGLWIGDGTAYGTYELNLIGLASTGADPGDGGYFGLTPADFTALGNGEVLFSGWDIFGYNGLWVSDGTNAGTQELTVAGAWTGSDPNSPDASGLSPSDLTLFKGKALFSGIDLSGSYGLWVTDGTDDGTFELTATSFSDPYNLTVFNGEALFAAADPGGETGLWITDGTAAGHLSSLALPGRTQAATVYIPRA